MKDGSFQIIKKIPQFKLVEKPPFQNKKQQESVLRAEREIKNNPHLFLGKIYHVDSSEGDVIQVFQTDFSWNLTQETLPGKGSIGISLLLEQSPKSGSYLWQRRGADVILPGLWDFAVSGSMESLNIEDELRREAAEEIGQNDLLGLRPYALIHLFQKLEILFHATWSGEKIIPNKEIIETVWSDSPPKPQMESVSLWEKESP